MPRTKKVSSLMCLSGRPKLSSSMRIMPKLITVSTRIPKFQALKDMYEHEKAKEELVLAIKLEPDNKSMRAEYDALVVLMSTKQREWYDKMQGFYKSDKCA